MSTLNQKFLLGLAILVSTFFSAAIWAAISDEELREFNINVSEFRQADEKEQAKIFKRAIMIVRNEKGEDSPEYKAIVELKNKLSSSEKSKTKSEYKKIKIGEYSLIDPDSLNDSNLKQYFRFSEQLIREYGEGHHPPLSGFIQNLRALNQNLEKIDLDKLDSEMIDQLRFTSAVAEDLYSPPNDDYPSAKEMIDFNNELIRQANFFDGTDTVRKEISLGIKRAAKDHWATFTEPLKRFMSGQGSETGQQLYREIQEIFTTRRNILLKQKSATPYETAIIDNIINGPDQELSRNLISHLVSNDSNGVIARRIIHLSFTENLLNGGSYSKNLAQYLDKIAPEYIGLKENPASVDRMTTILLELNNLLNGLESASSDEKQRVKLSLDRFLTFLFDSPIRSSADLLHFKIALLHTEEWYKKIFNESLQTKSDLAWDNALKKFSSDFATKDKAQLLSALVDEESLKKNGSPRERDFSLSAIKHLAGDPADPTAEFYRLHRDFPSFGYDLSAAQKLYLQNLTNDRLASLIDHASTQNAQLADQHYLPHLMGELARRTNEWSTETASRFFETHQKTFVSIIENPELPQSGDYLRKAMEHFGFNFVEVDPPASAQEKSTTSVEEKNHSKKRGLIKKLLDKLTPLRALAKRCRRG